MWSRKCFYFLLLVFSNYVGTIMMSSLPSMELPSSGYNFSSNSTSNETLIINITGKPSLKRFRFFLVPINVSSLQTLKRVEMPQLELLNSSFSKLNRTEMWLRFKETFEKDVQSHDSYHDDVIYTETDDGDHVATLTDVPAISFVTSSSAVVDLNATYDEMAPNTNDSESRSFDSVLSASSRVVQWFEEKFPDLDLEEPLENVRDHIINQSIEMEMDVELFLKHVFDVLEGSESNRSRSRFHSTARLLARHFLNVTADPIDGLSTEDVATSSIDTEENGFSNGTTTIAFTQESQIEIVEMDDSEDRQLDFSSDHAATSLLRMFEEWLNTTYTKKCTADSTAKDCNLLLKALEKCLKSLDSLELDERNSSGSMRFLDLGFVPSEESTVTDTTVTSLYGSTSYSFTSAAGYFGRSFQTGNATVEESDVDFGFEGGYYEVNGTRQERDSLKMEQLLKSSFESDSNRTEEEAPGSGNQEEEEETLNGHETVENLNVHELFNKTERHFRASDLLQSHDTMSVTLNASKVEDEEDSSLVSSSWTSTVADATTYSMVLTTSEYVQYGYGRNGETKDVNGTTNSTHKEMFNAETMSTSVKTIVELEMLEEEEEIDSELKNNEDEMERIKGFVSLVEIKEDSNETDLFYDTLSNESVLLNFTSDEFLLMPSSKNVTKGRNMDWNLKDEQGGNSDTMNDFDKMKHLPSDGSSSKDSNLDSGFDGREEAADSKDGSSYYSRDDKGFDFGHQKDLVSGESASDLQRDSLMNRYDSKDSKEDGLQDHGDQKDLISSDSSRLSNAERFDFGQEDHEDISSQNVKASDYNHFGIQKEEESVRPNEQFSSEESREGGTLDESDNRNDFSRVETGNHGISSPDVKTGDYNHFGVQKHEELVQTGPQENLRDDSSVTGMKYDDFGQREGNVGIADTFSSGHSHGSDRFDGIDHRDDFSDLENGNKQVSSQNVKASDYDHTGLQREEDLLQSAPQENLRDSSSDTGIKYGKFGQREENVGGEDKFSSGHTHESGRSDEIDHQNDFSDQGADVSSMGASKESERGSFHEEFIETDSKNRNEMPATYFDVRSKQAANETRSFGRSGNFEANLTIPAKSAINSHIPPSLLEKFTILHLHTNDSLHHMPSSGNESVSEDYDYYFENWHSDDNSSVARARIESVTPMVTDVSLDSNISKIDLDYDFEKVNSGDNSNVEAVDRDHVKFVTPMVTDIPLDRSNSEVDLETSHSDVNSSIAKDRTQSVTPVVIAVPLETNSSMVDQNFMESDSNAMLSNNKMEPVLVSETNTSSVFHEGRDFENGTASIENATTVNSTTQTSLNITQHLRETQQTLNPQDVIPELEDILNQNLTTSASNIDEEQIDSTNSSLQDDPDNSTIVTKEPDQNMTVTTLAIEPTEKLVNISEMTKSTDENSTSTSDSDLHKFTTIENILHNSTIPTERHQNSTENTSTTDLDESAGTDNSTTTSRFKTEPSFVNETNRNTTILTTIPDSSSMNVSHGNVGSTSMPIKNTDHSTTPKSMELSTFPTLETTTDILSAATTSNITESQNATVNQTEIKFGDNLPPFTYDQDYTDDDKEIFVPLEDVGLNDTWFSQKFFQYLPNKHHQQQHEETKKHHEQYHSYYHKEQSGTSSHPSPPPHKQYYGQKPHSPLVHKLNEDIESPEELYNEPLPFRPLNVPTMNVLCQKDTDCNREMREICIINGFFSFCDCPLYYQRHPATGVCVERFEPDPGFLIRAKRDESSSINKLGHCSEELCSNNGNCHLTLNNSSVCTCYTWYFGRKCQIDAMVVVLCILAGMSILSILALVFSSLYCLRKRSHQGWHAISPY